MNSSEPTKGISSFEDIANAPETTPLLINWLVEIHLGSTWVHIRVSILRIPVGIDHRVVARAPEPQPPLELVKERQDLTTERSAQHPFQSSCTGWYCQDSHIF